MKRHDRLELQLPAFFDVLRHFFDVDKIVDLEDLFVVLGNAKSTDIDFSKLSSNSQEVGPLDVLVEFVVVALSTVEALAEERSRGSRGEHVLINVAFVRSDRDEVRCGFAGPQPICRDDLADDLIVRLVLFELTGQPVHESVSTEDDERAILRSDETPRESLGKVVRKSGIVEVPQRPSLQPVGSLVGLKLPNLLKRRHGSHQRNRQPPQHEQIVRRLSVLDVFLLPAKVHVRVDVSDDCGQVIFDRVIRLSRFRRLDHPETKSEHARRDQKRSDSGFHQRPHRQSRTG